VIVIASVSHTSTQVTYLDTAFTPQTLLGVNGYGLFILHLEDIHRTNLDTFFASFTFVSINDYVISHMFSLLYNTC
jgi:hypothetical protein